MFCGCAFGGEADERRIVEEIAVIVVLHGGHHDVRLRDAHDAAHVEQQEVLLPDAGVEVLQHLRGA